jgi:cytochrome P450
MEQAAFMTIEHDVHRMRRAAMNKYFSKAAVGKLESYIRQSCEKFAKRLLEHANTGPLRITSAYSSFTTDVVSEYCFGFSFQYMDRFQFEPNMHAAANGFGDLLPTLRMLPWLGHLMRLITPYVFHLLKAGIAANAEKPAIDQDKSRDG